MGRYLELASTAMQDRWAKRAAAALSRVTDNERRADLRDAFEERAGILEFDAGQERDTAEEGAFRHLLTGLAEHRPGPSLPDDLGETEGRRTA